MQLDLLASSGRGARALALSCAVVACADSAPTQRPVDPPVDPNDPAFQRSAHVVAPTGAAANTGDADAPWDLATALRGASGRVTAGDTIWIRAGTYSGSFVSTVAGAPGVRTLVRATPGERVVLSHQGSAKTTLDVRGDWSTFWGLEITNPSLARTTSSTASEVRPNAIVNNASHTRYINLVVHNAGVGFFNYPSTRDVEVTGSVFFNNGWQAPDRGHGHAMYVKSDNGPVVLRQNVIFNQFGWGVHAYSNGGAGELNGIHIDRNVAFNNGALAASPNAQNILLGGVTRSNGSAITGNWTWQSEAMPGVNVAVGYGNTPNGSVTVTDNVFAGGDPVLRVGRWASATIGENTLAGPGRMVVLEDSAIGGFEWLGTRQLRDPLSLSWVYDNAAMPFALWTTATGLGTSDVVSSLWPTLPDVYVLPDANELGRAFVVVFNWGNYSIVSASLDGVLASGDTYVVHNIQDLFGSPLQSGSYSGVIMLPMSGVAPPVPVGLGASRAPRTAPGFDVFLIRRQ